MRLRAGVCALAWGVVAAATLHAQTRGDGRVSGMVADSSTRAPLENVSVVLRSRADSVHVIGTTTRADGHFVFEHVAPGRFVVECSLIGHRIHRTPEFVLTPEAPTIELPPIALRATALVLPTIEVSTDRSLLSHAVDRRVYNIDHDLMAKSSSVSDLLQNIPSVQVDLDGNVSLRGSPDVMILIDGKKSPLMGKSRADVLQQLPAASIEKIEVITNPSARFTPEGTSGIINIVTRQGAASGISGDVTGHLGTQERHNETVAFGYRPGRFELFGSYGHRDDRRTRVGTDHRTLPPTGTTRDYREDNHIVTLPSVQLGNLGVNFHPNGKNLLGLSAEHFERRPSRDGLSTIVLRDSSGAILSDHDRRQTGGESERETGLTGVFEHDFAKEDHTLRLELNATDNPQTERAHFVDHWRVPAQPDPASDVVLGQTERQGTLSLDYSDPIDEASKLEAGYALERHRQDIRSDADSLDLTAGAFVPDPSRTYRFQLDQAIHAVYGTYERSLGRFRVLGGLRGEVAIIRSDLVTGGTPFRDVYTGLYPTLHTSYAVSKQGQVQLNYSRRIRRPESDDLNPFPEFTDPYNIDSGNPRLRPESIHSVELGYRYRGEHFSFEPTLYFRDRQNGFTRVTQAINDTTFLRTMANLASDRSAGLEPVLTMSLGRALQANLNGNVFYEQIDASNLGDPGRRSVVSWSGTFNATLTLPREAGLELNSSYRSARLTPQGESHGSFVLNLGARQKLLGDRLSVTLAVSDLLRTQRQDTELNVDGIDQRVTNRRDSRIGYAGLSYHFGSPEKDDRKDKPIQYEDPGAGGGP